MFYVVAQAEKPLIKPDPTSQAEATQTLMVSLPPPRECQGGSDTAQGNLGWDYL